MLSTSHWLLAQARFCGRMYLPLSPNSTTPTVQVIFRYLRPDAPVFNIHRIHSTCGQGDILAITLLIFSLSRYCCLNILWYSAPVEMTTFRWSHRSYQSICQQHLPYSHPQVTLIYYMRTNGFVECESSNNANHRLSPWNIQKTNGRSETIQNTGLQKSVTLLRGIQENWGNLLSRRLH